MYDLPFYFQLFLGGGQHPSIPRPHPMPTPIYPPSSHLPLPSPSSHVYNSRDATENKRTPLFSKPDYGPVLWPQLRFTIIAIIYCLFSIKKTIKLRYDKIPVYILQTYLLSLMLRIKDSVYMLCLYTLAKQIDGPAMGKASLQSLENCTQLMK